MLLQTRKDIHNKYCCWHAYLEPLFFTIGKTRKDEGQKGVLLITGIFLVSLLSHILGVKIQRRRAKERVVNCSLRVALSCLPAYCPAAPAPPEPPNTAGIQ